MYEIFESVCVICCIPMPLLVYPNFIFSSSCYCFPLRFFILIKIYVYIISIFSKFINYITIDLFFFFRYSTRINQWKRIRFCFLCLYISFDCVLLSRQSFRFVECILYFHSLSCLRFRFILFIGLIEQLYKSSSSKNSKVNDHEFVYFFFSQ